MTVTNNRKRKTKKIQLKEKEMEILLLLYRFRFLDRVQIQAMLNHKYQSKVQKWLDDLMERDCVRRDYSKKFAGKAAVYYLSPTGRKQLKNQPSIKAKLLNSRVWREKERTREFRGHCLFIADIYLSLMDFVSGDKSTLHFYTKTNLYGKSYIIRPNPDAYFGIESIRGNKRFFLDCFDDISAAQLRRRVREYLAYYNSDKWSEKYPDKPFPEIILICPSTRTKGHLYFYILSQLDEYPELSFYLTTKELIQKNGLTRETLEKVTPKD